MALILITPPAVEPLTLEETKSYLRVEHADDDDLITALIVGARGHVEARTRRALITQTWRMIFDAWPVDGRLTIPLAPVRELSAARVYDSAGVAHALDTETFVLDAAASPGVVGFPPWAVAVPGRAVAGIEIDFVAGFGDAGADVPEPLRQAMRQLVAHWYDNRGIAAGAPAAERSPVPVDALLAPYRTLTL